MESEAERESEMEAHFAERYGLGWRGRSWYVTKKFKKEQMKLLGQIKPRRWELLRKIKPRELKFQFLRRPLIRSKVTDTSANTSETIVKMHPPKCRMLLRKHPKQL